MEVTGAPDKVRWGYKTLMGVGLGKNGRGSGDREHTPEKREEWEAGVGSGEASLKMGDTTV